MIVGLDTSVLVRLLTGEPRDLVLAIPNLESSKPGFIDRVIHRNYLSSGAEQVATLERAAAKLPRFRVLAP